MSEQFTNNATTTLNGAIDNSQTSLTVTSATGFPSSGNFRIFVKAEGANTDEIMTVTAVSGTTFTVTRASEAVAGVQSASAHASGATVAHVLTSGSLTNSIPTRTYYKDYAVSSGGTVTIADGDVARIGAALIFPMDGNDGGCFIQYYRSGTFNTIVGTSFGGGNFEFRGTIFSAGSANFSIYLASNSAGATINLKDNAGFGRTFRLLEFASPGNLIV